MHLIFVRHGQPVAEVNTDGTIANPGLSELGRWQSERLSQWLSYEPIDHIITSPKLRAQETVAGLIDHTGIDPVVIDGFDEIDRFATVYHPTERLAEDGGDYWTLVTQQRWADLGWDSPEEFAARVGAAYEALAAARPGERVVVACHGGTIRFVIGKLLGLSGGSWLVSDYASITRVEVNDDGVGRLYSVNETGHFDADRSAISGVWKNGSPPGATPAHP